MVATFQIYDETFSAEAFTALTADRYRFDGFEAAQSFVRSWLDNKQFFSQKSSGSTGKPTIFEISRSQITASAERTASALDLQPEMKALICINMGYIGGKMMLARGLLLGWHMHITPPGAAIADWLPEEAQFDFSAMVPLQIEALLKQKKGKALLNRIDKVIVGGAAASEALIQQLQSLSCQVYATYGMTETVSHIALQLLNGAEKANSFQLLPGVAHGLDARDCLKIKADVTNDQWIQTNDIVQFTDTDRFRVIGRADNVINTGGVKVQVESLEAAIAQTGLISESAFAITSAKDTSLGQQIVLVLESKSAPPTNLINALKPLLPAYHTPKAVFTLPEFPKTMSGKLDRIRLRALVLARPI